MFDQKSYFKHRLAGLSLIRADRAQTERKRGFQEPEAVSHSSMYNYY